MKGIIIYRSKYGATQQYADWIAEELKMDSAGFESVSSLMLESSEFLIICSPVYFGKVFMRDWIKQYSSILQNKKLFLVIVCATPSSEREKQQKILTDNIDSGILKASEAFFLPGRLILEKLSLRDRLTLKIGALFTKDPARKAAIKHDIDAVKKENVNALIKRIREYTATLEKI